jgi:uncharacterized membrane protein SirB2
MSLGDLIFTLGQWLRTTPMTELSLAIQKSWLSALIVDHFWVVPTIQTIHILAIATVFSSVLMVNLRIVQLAGRSRTMSQTVQRYLPWVWWGLLVLLVTGIGMIFSDPVRNLTNPVFWTKMILVVIAATISLWFQGSVRRNADRWELTYEGRVLIRVGAGAVIALWCLIMLAGRWIAYAPT